jgi:SnoaL-like polyketide cyclase
MNSRNVETHRAAHESWNRRDFQEMLRNSTEGFAYSDHGRNINLNGRDKFREWAEAWAQAFSDGRIMNSEYIDAGDIVVAQFTAVGTNDGPFGSMNQLGARCHCPSVKSCTSTKKGGWYRAAATTTNTPS